MNYKVPLLVSLITVPASVVAIAWIVSNGAKKQQEFSHSAMPRAKAPHDNVVLASGSIDLSGITDSNNYPVLFIILRPAGQQGMPYATRKISLPATESVSFELTQSDIMIAGSQVPPKLDVVVRLDTDGDALTKDGPEAGIADVALGQQDLVVKF